MRYLGSKESLTEPIIKLLDDKNLLWKELVFFDAFYHLLETLNYERPHQSLANFTPASFYGNKEKKAG